MDDLHTPGMEADRNNLQPPIGSSSHTSTQRIRVATIADLKYVLHLQKKFSNDVGFLPRPALESYLQAGHIRLTLENDEPAGYILGRPHLNWQPLLRPITQAAVQLDAQRRHHGLALLASIEAEAAALGMIGLQANCAIGVQANEFWHAAGFVPVCHLTPKNARNRQVICWRKPLVSKIPLWFAMPPERHGSTAHHPRIQRDTQRSAHALEFARRYISRRRPTQQHL